MTHAFLIVDTCYWHHEWEKCGVCGVLDRPDDPAKPWHKHHDEAVERNRMKNHPRHAEMVELSRRYGVVG